jgi:hypothetical protein
MGHWKFKPVVVIPSANLKEFNAALERQGYGPANMRQAVVAKTEVSKEAVPTHYVLECTADAGMMAAIKAAYAAIKTGVALQVEMKPRSGAVKQTSTADVLSKVGLKVKEESLQEEARR